jgi:DNA-binding NarL/FixJ family response regulator
MTTKTHKPRSTPKKINVWIVDDNPRYCIIVSDALNETKRVHCSRRFHRCEAFLSALRERVGLPDVILLDVRMPGISGLASIRRIRELSPLAKIIILSAYDELRYIFKAFIEGASGYLLKTSTSAGQILEAIRVAMDGGVVLDKNISANLFKTLVQKYSPSEKYGLTTREKEIIELIVEGQSSKEVADKLRISDKTVVPHLKNIFHKLDVHNRAMLVAKVMRERIV